MRMAIPSKPSEWRVGSLVNWRIVWIAPTIACLALGAWAVDWRQTLAAISAADLPLVALSTMCLPGTFACFALRWRQLIAVENPPPPNRVFNLLMIGYLANAVLPARPGDIIRAVLLRQIFGISFSYGMAGIVLERLFDVLAICGLGLILSLLVSLPHLLVSGLYTLAAAGLILLAVLLSLNRGQISLARLPGRFPRLFRHALARFLAEWLERFAAAIGVLYSPMRLALVFALTFVGWGVLAISSMLMISAFHLPVPSSAALLVLVATNLAAVIPSVPSSVGIYHFMAVLALSVWHVDTSTALAFAIVSHAAAIGLHVVLGAFCASLEGVAVKRLTRLAEVTG